MTGTEEFCAHCGGPRALRNPSGHCDHLYWPELLTDEARKANGYRLAEKTVWEAPEEVDGAATQSTPETP